MAQGCLIYDLRVSPFEPLRDSQLEHISWWISSYARSMKVQSSAQPFPSYDGQRKTIVPSPPPGSSALHLANPTPQGPALAPPLLGRFLHLFHPQRPHQCSKPSLPQS